MIFDGGSSLGSDFPKARKMILRNVRPEPDQVSQMLDYLEYPLDIYNKDTESTVMSATPQKDPSSPLGEAPVCDYHQEKSFPGCL